MKFLWKTGKVCLKLMCYFWIFVMHMFAIAGEDIRERQERARETYHGDIEEAILNGETDLWE